MLTSPISIVLSGVTHVLSRVNQDNYASVHRKQWTDTGVKHVLTLNVRHTYQGKAGLDQLERHNVELIHEITSVAGERSVHTAYSVFTYPRIKDPGDAAIAMVGLNTFVSANVALLASWES
jgi:hypothetical protein